MTTSARHIERGTDYGASGVKAYANSHGCSDMEHFLNRHIRTSLEDQKGKNILDAGCGAGPWSIFASKFAKHVEALDIQPKMIEEANQAIKKAGLTSKINTVVGDATELPYMSASFGHVLSINVGCNLPVSRFDFHFEEIGRVLEANGSADISAPDSLDILFTDGQKEDQDILENIDKTLESMPSNPEPHIIQAKINGIENIVSATFLRRDNRLIMLDSKMKMSKGDPIWRKLSKVTIPNSYYSDDDYLTAFKTNGLVVENTIRDKFGSEKIRTFFNQEGALPPLGKAYINNSPFVIYQLRK